MRTILIAESGGTGTDWCFINELGEKHFFESESYHPSNWNDAFWIRSKSFLKGHNIPFDVNIQFYGAGCLNRENANEIADQFRKMGFLNVRIESDISAAGKASYGTSMNGVVIIMGTGSVQFMFDQGQVSDLIGGKGHEIGDEGSGYYFGKLILDKYSRGVLNTTQKHAVETLIETNILEQAENRITKFNIASIAKSLGDQKELFEEIHLENLEAFISSHWTGERPSSVTVVGSYGFNNKALIKDLFSRHGCRIKNFIQRPILTLIEQINGSVD